MSTLKLIKKAIIPAAGLGTRFLPATKAMPKEMLPILDKPTIQYIVEEAAKAGIEDIIIVTGKHKRSIEDHFDNQKELEMILEDKGKTDLLEKVTHSNEEEIEKDMDELISKSRRYVMRDENHYMLFNEKYNNDRLIEKVCKHGGKITYYTDSVLPYYVLKDLSSHPDSEVVYRMRNGFTAKEVDNIALSFMGTKVIIDISVVFPYVNPYDIIRSLHDIKTNVDEVHLSFPRILEIDEKQEKFYFFDGEAYDLKPEYKVDFADKIRVSLSVWKMYIYILTSSRDFEDVDDVITKLKQQRKIKI